MPFSHERIPFEFSLIFFWGKASRVFRNPKQCRIAKIERILKLACMDNGRASRECSEHYLPLVAGATFLMEDSIVRGGLGVIDVREQREVHHEDITTGRHVQEGWPLCFSRISSLPRSHRFL